ncbi:MAG: hypothetical protein ACE5KR_01795, partial [Candidatus Bipolaricaulia bacterium]
MKRSLALALVFLLVVIAAAAAQTEEGHYARYNLKVKLDPQAHTLSGSEFVEYYNDSEDTLSSLYLLLLPNFGRERNPYLDRSYIDRQYWNGFDPSWMEIGAVTTPSGEKVKYELLESPPELQTY